MTHARQIARVSTRTISDRSACFCQAGQLFRHTAGFQRRAGRHVDAGLFLIGRGTAAIVPGLLVVKIGEMLAIIYDGAEPNPARYFGHQKSLRSIRRRLF